MGGDRAGWLALAGLLGVAAVWPTACVESQTEDDDADAEGGGAIAGCGDGVAPPLVAPTLANFTAAKALFGAALPVGFSGGGALDWEKGDATVAFQLEGDEHMRPLQPDAALGAVVGGKALPRTQVVKKLWAYIKKNNLQDSQNRRMINADEKLRNIFGGKKQVSMFEMTKLVNKHLK